MQNLFTFSILRPYFDLGPLTDGPLHARRPVLFLQRWDSEEPEVIGMRMWMVPHFRERAVLESGKNEYWAVSPEDLPPQKRTPAWDILCSALSNLDSLPLPGRLGLAQLLTGLCYYERAIAVVQATRDLTPEQSPTAAALLFLQTVAQQLLADFRGVPVSVEGMAEIARRAPETSPARLHACLWCMYRLIKLGTLPEATQWESEARQLLGVWGTQGSSFDAALMEIAYWQAMTDLRVAQQAPTEAVAASHEARALIRGLSCTTQQQLWVAEEALQRWFDRGIKRASEVGDLSQALVLAEEQVKLDPFNAKAHYQMAQVLHHLGRIADAAERYTTAAHLGPFGTIGTSVAWFYAGSCYEQLGNPEVACDCYLEAVNYDPLSTSSLRKLTVVARRSGFLPAAHWAEERLEQLTAGGAMPLGGVANV